MSDVVRELTDTATENLGPCESCGEDIEAGEHYVLGTIEGGARDGETLVYHRDCWGEGD
jgi:hypothetical protein